MIDDELEPAALLAIFDRALASFGAGTVVLDPIEAGEDPEYSAEAMGPEDESEESGALATFARALKGARLTLEDAAPAAARAATPAAPAAQVQPTAEKHQITAQVAGLINDLRTMGFAPPHGYTVHEWAASEMKARTLKFSTFKGLPTGETPESWAAKMTLSEAERLMRVRRHHA